MYSTYMLSLNFPSSVANQVASYLTLPRKGWILLRFFSDCLESLMGCDTLTQGYKVK